VRTDAQGIDVDALTAQLEALDPDTRPKLLYTVPTFANPTGATLPAARREALARLAMRFRFVLVEDDPYGELRFTGEPVKPIAAFADAIPGASDWVVYFGSLSKIVAPGLRIGWSIAPPAITRRMLVAKQTSDLCTSPLAQETARHYLESGRLAEHVPIIVQAYRKRYDALSSALRQFVPDDIDYVVPQGGMFVWARLKGGRHSADLLKRAWPGALAEDAHFARVRAQEVDRDAQERGLARAVGPEQAEHLAREELEGDGVDRSPLAESLGDAAEFERRAHFPEPPGLRRFCCSSSSRITSSARSLRNARRRSRSAGS